MARSTWSAFSGPFIWSALRGFSLRADSFATGAAAIYAGGFARWSDPSQYATPFLVGLIALAMLFQFTPRDLGRWLAQGLQWLPSPILGLILGGGVWLIWAVAPEGVAPFIYFQF